MGFVQVQIILSRLSQTNLLFQIRSNSEIHSIGEFESKKEQNQIKKPSRESFWDFKEKYIHNFEDSEEDRRDNLTG